MTSMTMFTIVIIAAIILPIAGYALYAIRISRGIKNTKQFFMHTSQLKTDDLSYTFAASWMAIGNVIVALLVLSLLVGITNIWAIGTWAIGFLILSRHVKQIKKLSGSEGTLHSFLGGRYAMPTIRILASSLTILACLGVIALELIVGAALLQAIPGISNSILVPLVGSIAFTMVLAFYASKGGFYAVIKTDRTQFFFIVFAVVAMVVLVLSHVTSQPDLAVQIPNYLWKPSTGEDFQTLWSMTGPAFILGILFFQFFVQLGDMGNWQRIIAAKDSESAAKSLRQVSWWTALLWSGVVLVGILLWSHPIQDGLFPNPDAILTTQAEPLPSLLRLGVEQGLNIGTIGGLLAVGLITVGLVAAMLSTADTYIVVIMQTLVQDLVFFRRRSMIREQNPISERDKLDTQMLKFGRRYLYFMALLGLGLFWILIPLGFDLLTLVFIIFGSQCVLAPLAVVALREDIMPNRYGRWALISGIIGFLAVYVFGFLAAHEGQLSFAYWAPVIGIGIPTITLTVVGMILDKFSPLWLVRSMLFGHYPVPKESMSG